MRKIYLLFFLIVISNVYSQNTEVSIVLKDTETNQPVEDATVFVLRTKQTLLSNSQGVVTFVLNGISNIQITHASYVPVTVRSSSLKADNNVVLLKSNVKNLDEIIITKQHPQKILKALVENSTNKLSAPARLKIYSREFFKRNGRYSFYNDGLMNFQISDRKKNFHTDILLEQNRSIGLVEEEFSSDLLGYNLNNIMENYYNFKYLDAILDVKAKKEFDFVIKAYSQNPDYYMMTVTPLEDTDELLDDFTIIYDTKKKIIIEVSSDVSPATLAKVKDKTSVGSKNIYKSLFRTIYRCKDSDYYLVSSKEEIGFERIDKKGTTNIEVRNYFVTTNFSSQHYSFKESEVFKDKAIFNKKDVIITDFWNVSGLTPTDEEKEIIRSIDKGWLLAD